MIRKGLLLYFFLILTAFVIAQDYDIRISSIELPMKANVPATFSIVKDSYGFIWFGTTDGLYRFDGQNFKIFRSNYQDSISLSSNTIRALAVDSFNNLWIGTQSGALNKLNLVSGNIKHYPYSYVDSFGLTDNNVWSLLVDNANGLWIGMDNNQLNRLNIQTGEIEVFSFIERDSSSQNQTIIRTLYQSKNGEIWIGTDRSGIYVFNLKTKAVKHYFHQQQNPLSLPNNYILQIKEDESGNFWFTSYGGGFFMKPKEKDEFIVKSKNILSDLSYSFVIDQDKNFLIGSESGLYSLSTRTNKVEKYSHFSFGHNALSDNRIRTIFLDSQNIFWIGSEAGVDKLIKQKNFKIYQNIPNSSNTIPQGIVRTIYKDRVGILWIGLINKGLVSYDKINDKYINWSRTSNQKDEDISFQSSRIFEDSNNNLWIGDWEKGLLLFNRKTHQFERKISTSSDPGLTDNRIQVIKEGRPGILWLGTETGINIYNIKTGEVNTITNQTNNPNTISGNSIQSEAFVFDKDSNLWVGTWSNGLNHIIFENHQLEKYTVDRYRFRPNDENYLSSDNVISLYLQNDSILWVGTFGGGLNCFNIQSKAIVHFSTADGLPNNVIYAINEDSNGNLWLSTDNGISRFNIETHSFHNFDKQNGLQDNHFFWGADYQALDGELFFGGINGLNSFYPENIKLNRDKYPVYVTEIKVNNKLLDQKLCYYRDTIVLEPDKDDIEFEFAILDYRNSAKTRFRIFLWGSDETWNDIGQSKTVFYSNLSPGTYKLNLQASNSDGFWQTEKNILILKIKAPWYKTPLAYFLLILFLFLLAFGAHKMRTYRLARINNRLSAMVDERTTELEMQKEELKNTLNKLSGAQKQLIQTEKMASLGTLVAGIAHEINNPVNYISSGWQILLEIIDPLIELLDKFQAYEEETQQNISLEFYELLKAIDYDFIKENIPSIKESISLGIRRTTQIVKSLNTYSHSRKDEHSLYKLSEAITNALLILKSKYSDRIKIHFEEQDIPAIECNPGLMNQLFMNILVNAIDAIDENGDIWIDCKQNMDSIEIYVKDTGSGIKLKDKDKVFDPFFTTKEVGKGTGLGLYICYQIVASHHGTININTIENKGTTVIVSLPIKNKKFSVEVE